MRIHKVRSVSNPQFRTGPHFKTCGKFCDYFDTVLCFPSSVHLYIRSAGKLSRFSASTRGTPFFHSMSHMHRHSLFSGNVLRHSYSPTYTHNKVPPYLSRFFIPYRPSRVLRSSSSSNLLQVPRTNLIFGSHSFRAAAPTVWNSLPDSIRSSNTLNSFRRHLKYTVSKLLLISPSGKPSASDSLVINGALYM